MKKIYSLLVATALLFSTQSSFSQCYPAGTQPVFGTVSIASGTTSFTNVPTGDVIQINCPAANTQYLIDLCGTNPGTNVPSGTNDGYITILDGNSATALDLANFDDGCTNMAGAGYGPPVGTWTAPAAGTYFIYLTEYDATGADPCTADGVNSNYDFSITVTSPPSNDLAIDSAYYPNTYSSISFQQLTSPFSVGARVKNQGSVNATNVTVSVRVRDMVSNTVVNTQTITGPSSLAAGATANVTGTAYNPPATATVYEFRYICSMTQTDANKTNDTMYRYISVDQSLLAYDQAIIFGTVDNFLGAGVNCILGQKYQINTTTTVDTIFAYFGWAQANVGQQVRAVVYNTANGLPTTQLTTSPTYTVQQADTPGKLVRFVPTTPITLAPGSYMIGIEQQGTVNMGLALTAENQINNNAFFSASPFSTWGAIENLGFPGSFVIWVNTFLNCTLQASGTGTNATCGANNGGATVNVTGNSGTPTYSWSNGSSAASLSNVAPGTYTVSVSENGCVDTAVVTITNVGAAPQINVTPTSASCGSSNGSATVNVTSGSGTYTYNWSNGGSAASISNVAAGSYTVTVVDGSCSTSATVFVSSTGGPTVSATSTSVSCNGGANGGANANATGGTPNYTYTWSNGGNAASISNVAAGTYTVTVSDANNCLSTASVTVNEPTAVTSNATATTQVSCHGGANGAVTANGNGGTGTLTYAWSNSGNTAALTNVAAGNYCVTVTDANSCSTSSCVTLSDPTAVTVTVSSTNVLCNGGSTGSASAVVTGGAGNYTYSWTGGQTTFTASNLAAGNYTVTATDANGCSVTAAATLSQPSALGATANCNPTIINQTIGSASVTVNGGTSPYNYSWSSGSDSASAASLGAGIVNVTVTDNNGCTITTNCEVQFTIGVAEVEAGISSFNLFPNPTTGKFNVSVGLRESSSVVFTIYDVKGALVMQTKEAAANQFTKAFDLTPYAKGTYTLNIKTANGSINKRIVTE
ncbi:MAG: T9SS type A sorting domain-containing protein [Chitinophagales bacterium]